MEAEKAPEALDKALTKPDRSAELLREACMDVCRRRRGRNLVRVLAKLLHGMPPSASHEKGTRGWPEAERFHCNRTVIDVLQPA